MPQDLPQQPILRATTVSQASQPMPAVTQTPTLVTRTGEQAFDVSGQMSAQRRASFMQDFLGVVAGQGAAPDSSKFTTSRPAQSGIDTLADASRLNRDVESMSQAGRGFLMGDGLLHFSNSPPPRGLSLFARGTGSDPRFQGMFAASDFQRLMGDLAGQIGRAHV